MSYALYVLPSAARDCDRLSREIYERYKKTVAKLASMPRPPGCQKLVGEDGYRMRFGDYRVLYRVDDAAKKVFIYRVKHRGKYPDKVSKTKTVGDGC